VLTERVAFAIELNTEVVPVEVMAVLVLPEKRNTAGEDAAGPVLTLWLSPETF